jgi:hypothetical protein
LPLNLPPAPVPLTVYRVSLSYFYPKSIHTLAKPAFRNTIPAIGKAKRKNNGRLKRKRGVYAPGSRNKACSGKGGGKDHVIF